MYLSCFRHASLDHSTPPPPIEGSPPPLPPTQQPPTSPPQAGSRDAAYSAEGSSASGKVHMVMEVSSSLELIKASSDDGKIESNGDEGEIESDDDDHVLQEPVAEHPEDKGDDLDHKDSEMSDVSSDLGEKDDDSSDSIIIRIISCLLYTSPSPRDGLLSRMPSSA